MFAIRNKKLLGIHQLIANIVTTSKALVTSSDALVTRPFPTEHLRNKCLTSSNRCLTSSNKKLFN